MTAKHFLRCSMWWAIKAISIVEVSIREGRNRQVRRMLEKIGHPVNSLKRISFGSLELGDLKPGKWRHVKAEEIQRLTEER